MTLASHRIILGNALTLDIPSGHELRADWTANGSTSTSTVTANDDGAEFRPSDLGRYYLATREDSTSDWCPAGLLVVVNLANDDYERICAELDTVNGSTERRRQREFDGAVPGRDAGRDEGDAHDRAGAAQAPRRPRSPQGRVRAVVFRAHAREVQLSDERRRLLWQAYWGCKVEIEGYRLIPFDLLITSEGPIVALAWNPEKGRVLAVPHP